MQFSGCIESGEADPDEEWSTPFAVKRRRSLAENVQISIAVSVMLEGLSSIAYTFMVTMSDLYQTVSSQPILVKT